MKIVTNIKEANSLMRSYKGASLQIAFYSESLKRIAIRLFFPNVDEVIYLVGVGCESINGSFSFSNANLSITLNIDEKTNDSSITKIYDKTSGFELYTSGGFSLAQGLESEFGRSFNNFLKD